ncbi:MAG: MotA/TolQ/ExbB proton channel family protein [Alkalispirochaetaceae bacterium]
MKFLRVFLLLLLPLVLPLTVAAQNGGDEEGDAREEDRELQSQALQEAYQREFIFLDNELRILQRRLEEVESEGEVRVRQTRRQLEQLEAELLDLTNEVERRSEELDLVDEERSEVRDTEDALANIIQQANSRLQNHDIQRFSEEAEGSGDELSEDERLLAEIEYVFDRSFELLPQLGEIAREEGTFFLENGEEVGGTIVHVGQVASFGVSSETGGTLAPAGGGRLRLVNPENEPVARQLASGNELPSTLPLFLYESLDELVEVGRQQTFADTVEGGGIIGIVILAIGGVSLILIILRTVSLSRVGWSNSETLNATFRSVERGALDEAIAKVEKLHGAMGRVMASTLHGLRRDPKNIEDVISESVLNEQPALDRFRSAISVFAAVAPLLGLLGTVTGMISTFDVITQYGTGDPQLLSGGISEALITTELGLAVAIPTLLIGNLLASWSDRITSNLEVSALRAVNIASGYEGAEVS